MASTSAGTWMHTQGGSMYPFVPGGSQVWVVPCRAKGLQRGDLICFLNPQGTPVAHRFHRHLAPGQFQAFADRSGALEAVPEDALIGRIDAVRCGPWMYKTASPLGHLMSNLALERRSLHRWIARLAWLVQHGPSRRA